jgi:hypothetical protein
VGGTSSSFGIGVVVQGFWEVWSYVPGFHVGPKKEHNIGWAKAVAVELGLYIMISHDLLSPAAAGSTFLVQSDNEGVVAVVNKDQSRSKNTNIVLKHMYSLLAKSQISLSAVYVNTRDNITNTLSCGNITGFLSHFPAAQRRAQINLPPHLSGKLQSA